MPGHEIKEEDKEEGFICVNCGKQIPFSGSIGTAHRNHCPYCLFSLHLDEEFSGDRASNCKGQMEPIGLTFKHEGSDKYKRERKGELMIIHKCVVCGKISINRLAADDDEVTLISLFNKSLKLKYDLREELLKEGINILTEKDKEEVFIKLFGKGISTFRSNG
ncbi:MAG: RNHCP domain-containing protein [Parcubacteria group bacterium]